MGEMADALIDEMIDQGYNPFAPVKRSKPSCKYCDKKNLKWQQTERGWRLIERGKLHVCDQYKKAHEQESD